MFNAFSDMWMRIRQAPIRCIWLAAIIWTVGCELGWAHLPLAYRDDGLRLTFNSMMSHLMHGSFDVDLASVGKEGFLRDGKVYAYWGVFPALLRLPFFIFPDALHLDITRLSIIISCLLILLFNYKLWRFVSDRFLGQTSWLSLCLAGALAFSGEQVCFFGHTLYQEVCFWALTFASWFVYSAVRSLFEEGYSRYGLLYMAMAASGALLTRVSMGIGLYFALLCFLIYFIGKYYNNTIERKLYRLPIVLSFFITGLGLLVTAYVNYKRWGNPLTFANYDLYIMNSDFPSRLWRTKTYGLFNIKRFYLGVIYFFFPVWIFSNARGQYFLQDEFTRLIDAIELPPSSFLLTDAFMLFLGTFMLIKVMQGKVVFNARKILMASVAGALAIPAFLMMIAISMNYRYRAEFYPDIIFLGVLGCIYLQRHGHVSVPVKRGITVLLVVSIFFSNMVCILYAKSSFGPAYLLIHEGIGHYYMNRFF